MSLTGNFLISSTFIVTSLKDKSPNFDSLHLSIVEYSLVSIRLKTSLKGNRKNIKNEYFLGSSEDLVSFRLRLLSFLSVLLTVSLWTRFVFNKNSSMGSSLMFLLIRMTALIGIWYYEMGLLWCLKEWMKYGCKLIIHENSQFISEKLERIMNTLFCLF